MQGRETRRLMDEVFMVDVLGSSKCQTSVERSCGTAESRTQHREKYSAAKPCRHFVSHICKRCVSVFLLSYSVTFMMSTVCSAHDIFPLIDATVKRRVASTPVCRSILPTNYPHVNLLLRLIVIRTVGEQ